MHLGCKATSGCKANHLRLAGQSNDEADRDGDTRVLEDAGAALELRDRLALCDAFEHRVTTGLEPEEHLTGTRVQLLGFGV